MPTFLLGPWGHVVAAVMSAAIVGSGVGWAVHRIDSAAYEKLQLSDATANLKATQEALAQQKALDAASTASAVAAAQHQVALAAHTSILIKRIPSYVPASDDTVLPPGVVCLLNSAAGDAGATDSSSPAASADVCSAR